jgi:hypothetical protein
MSRTPGPWKVMGEDVVLMRDEREVVAWVGDIDGQMIDNAHLIAAAPDMLEALEIAIWIIEKNIHGPVAGYSNILDAVRKARGEV